MDILTERGQETLQQVADAIDIWTRHYPTLQYVHTPSDRPADIDGVIIQKGTIRGIVEIKCRVSMSLEAFDNDYKSEWLVTFDKIIRCMRVSNAVQAPFVGFLYFPREKVLLYKTIYRPDQGVQATMRVENTATQATVNGGKINRDNAYIDMKDAKRLT